MTHTERQAGGWVSRAPGVCLHVPEIWLSCVSLLWALAGLGRSPGHKESRGGEGGGQAWCGVHRALQSQEGFQGDTGRAGRVRSVPPTARGATLPSSCERHH